MLEAWPGFIGLLNMSLMPSAGPATPMILGGVFASGARILSSSGFETLRPGGGSMGVIVKLTSTSPGFGAPAIVGTVTEYCPLAMLNTVARWFPAKLAVWFT